jgi:hypothetical protein
VKGRPNKTALHGLGSSVSYLRHYLTCMIFNVVMRGEDDDGNGFPGGTPGGVPRINPAQRDELHRLMRETETREARFLAAMAPGLRAIADAATSDFPRLRNALLTKKSILAQRARAAAAAAATGCGASPTAPS